MGPGAERDRPGAGPFRDLSARHASWEQRRKRPWSAPTPFLLILLGLLASQAAHVWAGEAGPPSLRQAILQAIRDHYAYPVDVDELASLPVSAILAALDSDSSLQEVEPSSLTFIRGFEKEGSVSDLEMLAHNVGYLRIGFFARRTLHDATKALRDLRSAQCGGLILDLRDNAGGRVEEAVGMASLFLPVGVLLGRYRGRGDGETTYVSKGPGTRMEPVIVLINGGTASSGEFFAGLLRYHRRALLVGARTAGKSTVQSAIPLGHRHLLLLTTGRYAFPDGSSVAATGLEPDHEVAGGAEAVSQALSILGQRGCEQRHSPNAMEPAK